MSASAAFIELIDGQIVHRDAEAWRHECLARHVLQLPSKAARQAWLADYDKLHGAAEATALQDTMRAIWAKERAA